MTNARIARQVSLLYDRRSLRGYVYWKVRSDLAYEAVRKVLHGRRQPVIDLGCGVGALAFFLREHGFAAPITGIDFDDRKIDAARRASNGYADVEFIRADVRDPLPAGRNLVLLDVLQYVDPAAQQRILENGARTIPAGGVMVIRQGIRDRSWRHKISMAVDAFGRLSRWMRAERLHFPAMDDVLRPFRDGFDAQIAPLWGRTPYNNYLFVFTRHEAERRPE